MADHTTSIARQIDDVTSLATEGTRKLDWVRQYMPILDHLRDTFMQERPLEGETIAMAMHVEAKTGVLVEVLEAAGAEVALTGCNPLSTHDDVSVALDQLDGIHSYARRGVDDEAYYGAIDAVLDHDPTITIDDGGDLIFRIHEHRRDLLDTILGGCEETTTGVKRLRHMAADDALEYPVFAVNDTPMKRLFDNVHGTGEASLASMAMSTNLSWAGKVVVVAGFGYCGKGIARKASGQNARVIVTEIDPRIALEAHMEGFEVMPMREAAKLGDIFITTTGNRDIITESHFEVMQDGAVMANAGHFDVEINLDDLERLADTRFEARDGVTSYEMGDGRVLSVLAEGRLVNLATPISLGHPIEVMDQSFGIQAVCARELATNAGAYGPGVHDVPDELDREIAEVKLHAEGIQIDELSERQQAYLSSWEHGT